MHRLLIIIILTLSFVNTYSQTTQNENYQFFIDLNNAENDQLTVELITPVITEDRISYKFPAMVPGTYKVYNFGRFVSDLKAFDASGNELSVSKNDINTWDISNANSLYKITYTVDDTYDDTTSPSIFEPVGTSIQQDTIFVFNNHGFFGYFDGYIRNDYTLNFTKPSGFFGSTSLDAVERSETMEIFNAPDYHNLVDNPIFFNLPDTATINFDETKILISVYSPGKGMTAKATQESLKPLMEAMRKFLGGELPADKYTFLYYFSSNTKGSGSFGALEHNKSSLYFMPDVPAEAQSYMLAQLQSTNAHEFYHIVTPLNLHSEEIGNFDFNNPVMSEHLWLYEGVTEYFADYIQLREGLMSLDEYTSTIEGKLNGSTKYNDTLPFTVMSKGALDIYEPQYLNVYVKGALIGMSLDILIREESNGSMGLQEVINKLLEKYGKDKSFKDNELFGEIELLTSPKVRQFLDKYVAGPDKIPYEEIFGKVGLSIKKTPYEMINISGVSIGFNPDNYRLKVEKIESTNRFIRDLGLKDGDELVSFNGKSITFQNARSIFGSENNQIKKGDDFELVVARYEAGGKEKKETLKAKVKETKTAYDFKLSVNGKMTGSQKQLQNAWLGKM